MSNEKRETIADIVAEKRFRADEIERDVDAKIKRGEMMSRTYADEIVADLRKEATRIEAAHQYDVGYATEAAARSVVKACADLEEAKRACGNAAAMRSALNIALSTLFGWQLGQTTRAEHVAAVNAIKAALAAPARNCDSYATVKDAAIAFSKRRNNPHPCPDFVFSEWLFAPETEHKGGAE